MFRSKRLSVKNKKSVSGFLFILPWLIGFIIFFISPLISTFRYSIMAFDATKLDFVPLENGAFDNYIRIFTKDTNFMPIFVSTLRTLIYQVPIVVIFSVFVGVLLKQNFRGRTFMRSVFFLPVIVNTGIISSIIRQSLLDVTRGGSDMQNSIFNPSLIVASLYEAGIPAPIINIVSNIISNSIDSIWLSGIQILIILAGLAAIPSSFYEVADVEGGSSWVVFWKVTLPSISPYILVVIVYTIVDSFTSTNNRTMRYLTSVVYGNYKISYGSALFWVYFLAVFLIIGIIFWISSGRIYYETK